jgi:hypothetical protein
MTPNYHLSMRMGQNLEHNFKGTHIRNMLQSVIINLFFLLINIPQCKMHTSYNIIIVAVIVIINVIIHKLN